MIETLFAVLILLYFISVPTLYLLCDTMSSKPSKDIQHQPLVIEAVISK